MVQRSAGCPAQERKVNDEPKDDGNGPVTLAERHRREAVRFAYRRLLADHLWLRGFGIGRGRGTWNEFCADMRQIERDVREAYGEALESGEIEGPDTFPDFAAAILLAVHYRLGQQSVPRQLPPLTFETWGELSCYFAFEAIRTRRELWIEEAESVLSDARRSGRLGPAIGSKGALSDA
jgi:hypothetical protein